MGEVIRDARFVRAPDLQSADRQNAASAIARAIEVLVRSLRDLPIESDSPLRDYLIVRLVGVERDLEQYGCAGAKSPRRISNVCSEVFELVPLFRYLTVDFPTRI